jgi:hypothetical protein
VVDEVEAAVERMGDATEGEKRLEEGGEGRCFQSHCPASTNPHRGGHQNRTGATDIPTPGLM